MAFTSPVLSLHNTVQRTLTACFALVNIRSTLLCNEASIRAEGTRTESGRNARRIVKAAADLHTSVGPAHTTVSAIAERAGVQRHTVYAHFPDDRTLFRACSQHWRDQHPRADIQRSLELDLPEQRLRGVLLDLYAWYEEVESDLVVLLRDAPLVPAAAEELAEEAEATAGAGGAPSPAAGRGARPCARRSDMRSSSTRGARSSAVKASRARRPSTRCCASWRPSSAEH